MPAASEARAIALARADAAAIAVGCRAMLELLQGRAIALEAVALARQALERGGR